MFSSVCSAALCGIDAMLVKVETDASTGLPIFEMSGCLGMDVREAKDRVRVAIKNTGIQLPPQRIIVNISPADIRKEGSGYDLPIAISILVANGIIKEEAVKDILFLGELSLDGSLNFVNGVLPIISRAKEEGIKACVIPQENINEGTIIKDIRIYGMDSLKSVINMLGYEGDNEDINNSKCSDEFLNSNTNIMDTTVTNTYDFNTVDIVNNLNSNSDSYSCSVQSDSHKPLINELIIEETHKDYLDIKGQYAAKRATVIAAAGMHNIMYIGPPGSGKSMLAKRIPGIMPDMTYEESLRLTKIYSVAGLMGKEDKLILKHPFRSPHHTITSAAMFGGGKIIKPGEITLAVNGVLFLDEMTEFRPDIIESLRQPLEDRKITLVRMNSTYTYPADFMLAAAINPCKCGYYPDRNRCHCSEYEIKRYIGRISNPMWDRFDICVKVDEVSYEDMTDDRPENNNLSEKEYSTASMKELVKRAQAIQKERYKNRDINYNSQMTVKDIKKYCELDACGQDILKHMYKKFKMTARGYNKVLKTARTIADVEESESISGEHISEALFYWNKEWAK